MVSKMACLLACVGGLVAARTARADDYVNTDYSYEETARPTAYSYAWNEPYLSTGIGVDIALGGGVSGFTDRIMRDTLDQNVAGLWDGRLSIGTHVPIGLDVSYIGTAGSLNALGGFSNGTLVGTTVEAALRWNILPHAMFNPYIFGGMGWTRYDVENMKFAEADTGMRAEDNVAEWPTGVGLSFRDPSGWNVDLRGTVRWTASSDLVSDPVSGKNAELTSWEASGGIGYEF
jgi:hypothetical protein